MKNLLITLAGIACLALSACDDDNDNNNVEPIASRMVLLTNKDWVLVSNVQTMNGRSIDNTLEISPKAKDDVFRFSENGEAIRDEGPSKEEGNPQTVETAQWSFANEEKSLDVAFDTMPIKDEIVELTKNKLVLRNFDGQRESIITFQAD